MNTIKRIINSKSFFSIFDQALVSLCNFATMLMIAKLLDVEAFSSYVLCYTSFLFLTSFHRALITQPFNVLGVTYTDNELIYKLKLISIANIMLIFIGAVIISALSYFYFNDIYLLCSSICFFAGFCYQEIVRRYFFTTNNIGKAIIVDAVAYIIQIGFVSLLLLNKSGNVYLPMAFMALSYFISFFVGWYFILYKSNKYKLKLENSKKVINDLKILAAEYWCFSRWIVWSQFVFWGASQLYPFILAKYVDSSSVANFNIANSILNIVNVVRLAMGNYLPSRFSSIFNTSGLSGLKLQIKKQVLIYSSLASVVLIMVAAVSEYAINYLYGNKYPLSASILYYLLPANLVITIGVIMNSAALPLRATNWIFFSNLAGSIFTFTIGIYLVATYGVWGAIVGITAGSCLPTIVQTIQLYIRFFKDK